MSLKQTSVKTRDNRKKLGIVHFLAAIALLVLGVYVIYSIVNDSIEIRESQKKYEELKLMTEAVEEDNEHIKTYLEDDANLDKYIEDMAREKLDFANANERIYYVIPASTE